MQKLESSLPHKAKLFSPLARRRGLKHFKKWGLIIILLIGLITSFVYYGMKYMEQFYSISASAIEFRSSGYISKNQCLELLNIAPDEKINSLQQSEMLNILEQHPCIANAIIRASIPHSLHIEIEERLPIAYVELEESINRGKRKKLFVSTQGVLFPIIEEYHQGFLNSPTWFLKDQDLESTFDIKEKIKQESLAPIRQLIAAVNAYELHEIPPVREIFRPKQWKIILSLDGGTEVMMNVYQIKEQIARLSQLLEHARQEKKSIRSANIIPSVNPSVIYFESEPDPQP